MTYFNIKHGLISNRLAVGCFSEYVSLCPLNRASVVYGVASGILREIPGTRICKLYYFKIYACNNNFSLCVYMYFLNINVKMLNR